MKIDCEKEGSGIYLHIRYVFYALMMGAGLSAMTLFGYCSRKMENMEKLIIEPKIRIIEVPKFLTGWETLTMAIIAVESEFDSLAVSEKNAYGILQITPVYVDEVNRILGTEKYTHLDAFSVKKSLEMFSIYQEHYNPEHDIEKAIRLHNPTAGGWYAVRVLRKYRKIIKYESIRKQLYDN